MCTIRERLLNLCAKVIVRATRSVCNSFETSYFPMKGKKKSIVGNKKQRNRMKRKKKKEKGKGFRT